MNSIQEWIVHAEVGHKWDYLKKKSMLKLVTNEFIWINILIQTRKLRPSEDIAIKLFSMKFVWNGVTEK